MGAELRVRWIWSGVVCAVASGCLLPDLKREPHGEASEKGGMSGFAGGTGAGAIATSSAAPRGGNSGGSSDARRNETSDGGTATNEGLLTASGSGGFALSSGDQSIQQTGGAVTAGGVQGVGASISGVVATSIAGATNKPRTGAGGVATAGGGTNSSNATRAGGTGGKNSSSKATGGDALGGSTSGGATSVPAGGANGALPKFILGADISSVDEAIDRGTKYADTDGTTKTIFEILKNHGFNFIRLRAFVEPGAKYGYAYGTGGSCVKTESYCDTDHTVAFAKQVKAAGMGLLLDLHYSDNWADPGNQIIPEAWRDAANITELASRVKTYTTEIVGKLADAGAQPDIVQIGNEITPGMLVHVPNSNTDCWGNNVSAAPVGGSTSNWANLGTLLKAGIAGVKAVAPTIKTMIHIENTKSTSGVVSWVQNAKKQDVNMDIVGLSCYVAFQGEPSVWKNTFSTLASTFSDLSFVIAEYNPQRTQANQIMQELPNGRGLGTFFWEPTQSGEWGSSMFTWSGNTGRANAADFQEFDAIAKSVGLK